MSAFGQLLKQLIEATGTNPRAFAIEHGPPSVSHVGNIIRGKRRASGVELRLLADALQLAGETRRRFFRLGWIAHLPEEAQPEFEEIVREVEILKRRLRRVENA